MRPASATPGCLRTSARLVNRDRRELLDKKSELSDGSCLQSAGRTRRRTLAALSSGPEAPRAQRGPDGGKARSRRRELSTMRGERLRRRRGGGAAGGRAFLACGGAETPRNASSITANPQRTTAAGRRKTSLPAGPALVPRSLPLGALLIVVDRGSVKGIITGGAAKARSRKEG